MRVRKNSADFLIPDHVSDFTKDINYFIMIFLGDLMLPNNGYKDCWVMLS